MWQDSHSHTCDTTCALICVTWRSYVLSKAPDCHARSSHCHHWLCSLGGGNTRWRQHCVSISDKDIKSPNLPCTQIILLLCGKLSDGLQCDFCIICDLSQKHDCKVGLLARAGVAEEFKNWRVRGAINCTFKRDKRIGHVYTNIRLFDTLVYPPKNANTALETPRTPRVPDF